MEYFNSVKLMVIDDEPWIREMLKDVLQNNGYLVKTEGNGLEALQKLKKEHFDALICDIDMPGCSGFTVLKRAKLIDSEVKIIMMTGSGNESYYYQSMSLGASGFFNKPFDLHQMLSVIERSTGSKKRTE